MRWTQLFHPDNSGSELIVGRVLGRRLHREPRWRGWGTGAALTAVAMAAFLAAFGATTDHGEVGGMFEKLATITAMVFTVALLTRLLLHDYRLGDAPAAPKPET